MYDIEENRSVKVSVIIPIYNSEEYIEECIKSVESQTLKNLEIICIDDGSTDNTLEKLYNLQKNDRRIHILKQVHSGAGPARNYGISEAEGIYIAFLDADDSYYEKDALECMVNACEENKVDICGGFLKIRRDDSIEDYSLFPEIEIKNKKGTIVSYREFQEDFYYQCFIYRKEFLIQNQIEFPPYLRYQDPPFFLKAMLRAGCFWVEPVALYCYREGHQDRKSIAKKINYILMGLKDNLALSIKYDLEVLYGKIIERINSVYYEDILLNLSDHGMSLLLEINEINEQYKKRKDLSILKEIYSSYETFLDLSERLSNVKDSHHFIKKIVEIQQSQYGFQQYFSEKKILSAVVYGLGEYGKILLRVLQQCGVKVVCCIDRQVSEYGDFRIIKPEDEIPECDALIISLIKPDEIVKIYEKENVKNLMTFRQIISDISAGF